MESEYNHDNLHAFNKLYHDCMHMLDFSTDCGKKVPDWVLASIRKISCCKTDVQSEVSGLPASKGSEQGGNGTDNGHSKPRISQDNLNELMKVYNALIEIVAPATPLTIEYTIPTVKTLFKWGSLCMPFIRGMWLGCLIFLICFIITGFRQPFGLMIPDNVILQLHLLFASGLGSYFYALYAANKYAVDRTFDPKYVTFYFNRIIIGIVAGLILTNIITDPENIIEGQTIITGTLTPTLVAILGGFSSEAVMRILSRLVAMLITLVQGETKDIINSKEQELKTKAEANLIKVKLNAANELLPVYNNLKDKMDADTFAKFKDVMDGLIKVDGGV